ncbi:MAG: hypothetical protein OXN17_05415 [Candidatus Poribacteria bacterium]|nr:hypothetical protein [Candidatus Poribacteria bacterium]MDE0503902.1 hypothetical protein [Candidatus Poribacteria bacterium]
MVQGGGAKPSYIAMLLSLFFPGLGQIYLGKWLRGFILILGVGMGGGLIYLNSLPIDDWRDLARFDDFTRWWEERRLNNTEEVQPSDTPDMAEEKEEIPGYHLWTFENGKKLMYRPSWMLKLSGLAQVLFFWMYAICDAWRGEKSFNRRAFRKRLREAKQREENEKQGSKPAPIEDKNHGP